MSKRHGHRMRRTALCLMALMLVAGCSSKQGRAEKLYRQQALRACTAEQAAMRGVAAPQRSSPAQVAVWTERAVPVARTLLGSLAALDAPPRLRAVHKRLVASARARTDALIALGSAASQRDHDAFTATDHALTTAETNVIELERELGLDGCIASDLHA